MQVVWSINTACMTLCYLYNWFYIVSLGGRIAQVAACPYAHFVFRSEVQCCMTFLLLITVELRS